MAPGAPGGLGQCFACGGVSVAEGAAASIQLLAGAGVQCLLCAGGRLVYLASACVLMGSQELLGIGTLFFPGCPLSDSYDCPTTSFICWL